MGDILTNCTVFAEFYSVSECSNVISPTIDMFVDLLTYWNKVWCY